LLALLLVPRRAVPSPPEESHSRNLEGGEAGRTDEARRPCRSRDSLHCGWREPSGVYRRRRAGRQSGGGPSGRAKAKTHRGDDGRTGRTPACDVHRDRDAL